MGFPFLAQGHDAERGGIGQRFLGFEAVQKGHDRGEVHGPTLFCSHADSSVEPVCFFLGFGALGQNAFREKEVFPDLGQCLIEVNVFLLDDVVELKGKWIHTLVPHKSVVFGGSVLRLPASSHLRGWVGFQRSFGYGSWPAIRASFSEVPGKLSRKNPFLPLRSPIPPERQQFDSRPLLVLWPALLNLDLKSAPFV